MTRSRKRNTSAFMESKVKSWIKRNDPDYIAKMKELSKREDIKKKRNEAGRIRRAGHSATHAVFKLYSPLTDKEGNTYVWNDKYKRLLKNSNEVVRRARNGTLHFMPYETESDLENPKYDEPIFTVDEKLCDNVEKLLNGDPELNQKMKKRKFVVERELDDSDCFWKKLTRDEKHKLLKKLKKQRVKLNEE